MKTERKIIHMFVSFCFVVCAGEMLAARQVVLERELMARKTQDRGSAAEAVNAPAGGVVIFTPSRASANGRKASGKKVNGGADRLAGALRASGLAVLRIELPVGAKNARAQTKLGSSAVERTVKSAIERLSAECGENGHRIAVLAEDEAAGWAVLGARTEWQVRSFVFISGRLSQPAKDVLAEWRNNPALCLVSTEDKAALRDMTDVYFTSKHADTDVRVFDGMGRGSEMIEAWAEQFPEREIKN
jgi:hypothetical protein